MNDAFSLLSDDGHLNYGWYSAGTLKFETGAPIAMRMVLRPIATMLVGGLCLLSGCKKQAASSGLFPVTLQTDWYPQPEHGGFYEALLKGYYKQEGLDVTISPGGPMIIGDQQVASGAATFAMESSDQVLVSVSHGLPLVAVAATLQRDPQGVMVHRDSPVKSFADLNGHAVSVRPGSIWFQYLIKKYNLNDVREIPATFQRREFPCRPKLYPTGFCHVGAVLCEERRSRGKNAPGERHGLCAVPGLRHVAEF